MSRQLIKRYAVILLWWLACGHSVIFANGLSFGTAADFTSGHYGGAAATDIWYVPFTVRYDKDRASFRLIVPYIDITGPGNVLGPGIGGVDGRGIVIGGFVGGNPGGAGIVVCDEGAIRCSGGSSLNDASSNNEGDSGLTGGIPIGNVSSLKTTKSGLGDIIAAFSYNLFEHAPSGIAFDVTTRLKIPTADASQHLGSGQVDYAVQGDLYKLIDKITLGATLGYRILGSPTGITFHNVFYGAASAGYRLSTRVIVGASFNMGQSPVRLDDSRDLTLYLMQRVTDNLRLNVFALRGFSERSPDWGGGISLRYVF